MRSRYQNHRRHPTRKRRCFEATQRNPSGTCPPPGSEESRYDGKNTPHIINGAAGTRLTGGTCELCDSTDGITVHHVKRLADLNRYSPTAAPPWVHAMRAVRRKTLIGCARCHDSIHQQQHTQ